MPRRPWGAWPVLAWGQGEWDRDEVARGQRLGRQLRFQFGQRDVLARSKRSTLCRSAVTARRAWLLPANCRAKTGLIEYTLGWSGSHVRRSLPEATSHTFHSVPAD